MMWRVLIRCYNSDQKSHMKGQTRVAVVDEIKAAPKKNEWTLAFQKVIYIYGDGSLSETGFRFIWYRPQGTLQAARGQARIPTLAQAKKMIEMAEKKGW